MMPCDRWQFEYSRVSGGERIRAHQNVKNKDYSPFHNSRFHVEESLPFPPYSCAVMQYKSKRIGGNNENRNYDRNRGFYAC